MPHRVNTEIFADYACIVYFCDVMPQVESSFFTEPRELAMPPGISAVRLIYESEEGAFRIFVARHLGHKVVLKALKADRRDDAVALMQLHKEFSLGFNVDSPAVCRTLAFHNFPESIGETIEMEFCEGKSLRQFLDSDTLFTGIEALEIASQALEALTAIHSAGIIHRDIKPANIIFDRARKIIKIIDFGFADSSDYALLKSSGGTMRYTPPDKRATAATPVPADDLYALGVTLQEIAQATAGKRAASALRRLGRDLCIGKFETAAQASQALKKHSGHRNLILPILLGVIPLVIAMAALITLLPSPRTAPVDELAESPEITDTIDEGAIEQYALAAGKLLRDSEAGRTSLSEEADAQVIRFSDSIYRADIMDQLFGKKYSSDTLRMMAAEYAAQYSARMHERLPEIPESYNPRRREALLRGRIFASLYVYHQKISFGQ